VTVTSDIELTKNPPTCNAKDGSFVISNITGGTGPFLLSFNGLSYSSDTVFNELGPGSYTLVIRDSNLCETNLILELPIDKNDYTLYVPNTFTPNKDLINDTWFAKATCINAFNCLIFNRWGEKIMELKDINEAWDGTYKGKNVPDGVYVYLIEAETNDGTIYKNGHITLFR
jgi:gliding motility-associated-like protein